MRDVTTYITLIQHNFPWIEIATTRPITRGWDSFVLEVNDELIFRFPQRDDVIPYLEKEFGLLPVLEPALSTPIPHFEMFGQGDATYPYRFVGYRKLGGVAFEEESITPTQLAGLAPALATFLGELHRFPVAQAVAVGVQDHTPEQWRERYRERYIDLQKRVFPLLEQDLCTRSARLWESFLENASLFTFQPALIHCDLGGEHILCDPARGILTGVIDWGDSAIGDPALDFVGLCHVRGREFTERVLADYQGTTDGAFWQRMDFYLSYGPFAELLFGAYEENERFMAQGIRGLHILFDG